MYISVGTNSIANVSNFVIRTDYVGNFNMFMSYFVVAIGSQPENDWIDMVTVMIPADPTQNSLMGGQNTIRDMTFQYTASSFIKFSNITPITMITFISSYVMTTYIPGTNTHILLTAWELNSTTFLSKI